MKRLFPQGATNSSRQLNILWHNCNTLSVNSTQVGVFKQPAQVCFGGLLQGQHGICLPSIFLSKERSLNFLYKSCKRQAPYQQIGIFLVKSNLFQGSFSRTIPFLCCRRSNSRCRRQSRFLWRFTFPPNGSSRSTDDDVLFCANHD